jgi:hypothetical protein
MPFIYGTVFALYEKTPKMKKFIFFFLLIFIVVCVQAQVNRTEVLQNLEKSQPSGQDQTIIAILKSSSRLFGDKDDLTSVILIIPAGDTVDVSGSDSTYLHVTYRDNEGYIFKRQAVIKETPVYATRQSQAEGVQQEEQPVQQQQVSRFTYLENKYGTNMAARLNQGKIWKGMTAEMVRDSWGNPVRINRVIGNSIQEEWIYRNTWLYIQNNTLMEWGPIRQ